MLVSRHRLLRIFALFSQMQYTTLYYSDMHVNTHTIKHNMLVSMMLTTDTSLCTTTDLCNIRYAIDIRQAIGMPYI